MLHESLHEVSDGNSNMYDPQPGCMRREYFIALFESYVLNLPKRLDMILQQ